MNLWLLRIATHIFAWFAGDALFNICKGEIPATAAGAAATTIVFLVAVGGAIGSWVVVDKKRLNCYDTTF